MVDEYFAERDGVADPGGFFTDDELLSVFEFEDSVFWVSSFDQEVEHDFLMSWFAVDGGDVEGFGEVEHSLDFFFVGMSGCVDRGFVVGDHIGTLSDEVIDGSPDWSFVAGDWPCGVDDGIGFTDFNSAVFSA